MEEQSQISGLITINGTDSEYIKYTFDQIIDLIKYAEFQDEVKNIVLHGYDIDENEKVIVFPKNSTISYTKC